MAKQSILQNLAEKYNCKLSAINARLIYLGYTVTCMRCGGTGKYSYNQMDGDRCYGCGGLGVSIKKLSPEDYTEIVARIDSGALTPYFARNVAIAWCKKQSKAVFAAWGDSNVGKAYGDSWQTIELAPEIYRINSEMKDLQELAHKIIYSYEYGTADMANAEKDKAQLLEIIAKIKAIDLPLEIVQEMMVPVLQAKENNRIEMQRLRAERLAKNS